MRKFLDEALLMRRFHHERVLPLLGISFYEHVPLIVTPYMENGDLKSYLLNEKNASFVSTFPLFLYKAALYLYLQTVDHRQLLNFAIQIADGMAHVHSVGVVHRDLACRNCL